jgi:hypothetical protein
MMNRRQKRLKHSGRFFFMELNGNHMLWIRRGWHRGVSYVVIWSLCVKKLFGKFGSIKPAPPRQSLIEFGGMMSIDEFRENNSVDTEERIEEIACEPEPNIVVPAYYKQCENVWNKGGCGYKWAITTQTRKTFETRPE